MSQPLGQHFLENKAILGKIADDLAPEDVDLVIEIGPGHGELTEEIVKRLENKKEGNWNLILLERDSGLINGLENKFSKYEGKVTILNGDALKLLPEVVGKSSFVGKNYKIAGNIPYYITGYLLRIIGELNNKPQTVVFTIQKEVAERICLVSNKMNLLAASIGFWAHPSLTLVIPKDEFNPPPKIDSATIKLDLRKNSFDISDEKYFSFIKTLFKQPRKTILNNLSSGYSDKISKDQIVSILSDLSIENNFRPEDLSLEKIVELAKLF